MNFAEYNVKDANLEEVLLALKSLDTEIGRASCRERV